MRPRVLGALFPVKMRAKVALSASPPPPDPTRPRPNSSAQRNRSQHRTIYRRSAQGDGQGYYGAACPRSWMRSRGREGAMVAAGPVWHSAAPPTVTHSQSPHLNPPWNKYMNKKAEILTRRSSQQGLIQPKQQESLQRKTTIKWGAAGTATGCPILILNTAHFWACASAPTYRTALTRRICLLSLSHVKVETDRLLRNKFGCCWSTCRWC